jgi:hypothetical protein
MEGYLINLETMEEYFNRCEERKAVTREEREAILVELVKELRAIKLNDKDMKNQLRGKRVLKIESKEEPE